MAGVLRFALHPLFLAATTFATVAAVCSPLPAPIWRQFLPGPVDRVQYASQAQQLLVQLEQGKNGYVEIWCFNADTGKIVRSDRIQAPTRWQEAAISPDAKRLITSRSILASLRRTQVVVEVHDLESRQVESSLTVDGVIPKTFTPGNCNSRIDAEELRFYLPRVAAKPAAGGMQEFLHKVEVWDLKSGQLACTANEKDLEAVCGGSLQFVGSAVSRHGLIIYVHGDHVSRTVLMIGGKLMAVPEWTFPVPGIASAVCSLSPEVSSVTAAHRFARVDLRTGTLEAPRPYPPIQRNDDLTFLENDGKVYFLAPMSGEVPWQPTPLHQWARRVKLEKFYQSHVANQTLDLADDSGRRLWPVVNNDPGRRHRWTPSADMIVTEESGSGGSGVLSVWSIWNPRHSYVLPLASGVLAGFLTGIAAYSLRSLLRWSSQSRKQTESTAPVSVPLPTVP